MPSGFGGNFRREKKGEESLDRAFYLYDRQRGREGSAEKCTVRSKSGGRKRGGKEKGEALLATERFCRVYLEAILRGENEEGKRHRARNV